MIFQPFFRRAGSGALAAGLLLGAAPAVPAAASPAAAAQAPAIPDFTEVDLPFFWPRSAIYGLDAASPDSVWISGRQGEITFYPDGSAHTIPGNPVVRRWNGGGWVEYPLGGLPNQGWITRVQAGSPENVWINGHRFLNLDIYDHEPYVARFTGSAFTEVALPPGTTDPVLQVDDSNTWLTTGDKIYRRTGDTWTLVTTRPSGSGIARITAADDIWNVETRESGTEIVTSHFDGQTWRTVPAEQPTPPGWVSLRDIKVLSPTDAWLAGIAYPERPAKTQSPLLMHWDGTSWTRATVPPGFKGLIDLEKGTNGTLWALAYLGEDTGMGLLRYNGTRWEPVQGGALPDSVDYIATLAIVPGTGHLWLRGGTGNGRSLVLSTQ
ncbi:hypothetical protein BJF79_37915 [Actinomadura sp. CNU-125]|uniref:hypothetical protein n=1 Tax=Actinomadura sp. CNU-125 TaxID=1904961 RepID=UPI00095A67D4|nr:hypothetical protein [Actinomadura sp. CNU-125]OLT30868.1 hypothetical protein BJF79_37915 [Actinomadura sp. CNU-125]